MIDVSPEHLELVIALIRRQVPSAEILVFGSRVRGGAKPTSDLDVAIRAPSALSLSVCGGLKETFEESDLPFRVDFVDWHTLDEGLRRLVDAEAVVLDQ